MFNSVVLDVFIGLVFIYLLYSLLATILQEMLARWLSLRTHNLTYAIRTMLEDRKEPDCKWIFFRWWARRWNSLWDTILHFFNPFPKNTLSKAFYHHPVIKYLGESQWKRKPAYLQPETFSETLVQLLRGRHYDGSRPQIKYIEDVLFNRKKITANLSQQEKDISIDSETLYHLQQIFLDANQDIERFKGGLESWFNETMDRASGWYKKSVQLTLLIIGLMLAITFNIDTIAIYGLLSVNHTARAQMVQLATASADKYGTVIKDMGMISKGNIVTTKDSGKTVLHVRDTIYVTDTLLNKTNKMLNDDMLDAAYIFSASAEYQKNCGKKLAGWLLTALAISLGAPFWFDLLNKLIQLRGTGPKPVSPNTAPDNSTEDKKVVPHKRVG
jgi:hypothetical protein